VTLLAPAFLAGLLAIGVPLWLHRLSADNPNRRRFSSLMFLEAGEPRRVLAKKLQYLLLLALRIGVLALLALAFAQPALFLTARNGSGNGARLHLLVMDTSASMAYQGRWNRARKAALDLIGSLPPSDRVQLIAADRSVKLISGASASRADVRRDVNSLAPGDFHLDYGRMMRSVDDVVRGAKLPVVVHIVTDAQRSALPERFAELAPREPAELDIRDIAAGSEDNWLIAQAHGSASSGVVTATVQSFAQSRAQKTVVLSLNGRQVQQRRAMIDAGGTAAVTFDPLDLKSGANRVALSLAPEDGLATDDHRYIALKRIAPRPVLLVSGDLRGRDTLYAASAMRTLTDLSLDVKRTSAAKLGDEKSLGAYAFIVVADAGALDAAATSRLSDYVNGGGAVLMAFGPRSNSLTTVPLTGQAFRPVAQVGSGQKDYAAIGAVDSSHPALRGVEGLRSARFFHYAAIQPGGEDAVLMRLDDGTPLLLEREVGDGRVLLFTSTLDRQWNDLPVHSAYVPLIAGLANHMLGGEGFSSEGRLGSVLSLQAAGMSGGQIFNPEGKPALGLGGGKDSVLLDETGFYELGGGGSHALVAVNFDPQESDLTTMTPEELSRWNGLGRTAAQGSPAGEAAPAGARLTPLADWLLWLLLAVIVMESWAGNWHLRVRRGVAT
jgi:hypothetical protein